MRAIFHDDSSPDGGASLEVWRDNQGDLSLIVRNADGTKSETIRICGTGGGSRYPTLAGKLAAAFGSVNSPVALIWEVSSSAGKGGKWLFSAGAGAIPEAEVSLTHGLYYWSNKCPKRSGYESSLIRAKWRIESLHAGKLK